MECVGALKIVNCIVGGGGGPELWCLHLTEKGLVGFWSMVLRGILMQNRHTKGGRGEKERERQ